MARVMPLYGTRPEAIKMAPIITALRDHAHLDVVVAVTGQHREMLDQVNEIFDIRPEIDMNLMSHGASVSELTTNAIRSTSEALRREKPNVVLVQGDTTTAFCGALASFYEQIPVVHIEAGLRTRDLFSPFPEEANRRLISVLASLHLAPTIQSKRNLLAEGVARSSIAVTGNTVIDALKTTLSQEAPFENPELERCVREQRRIILVTTHRRESWGDKMAEAMEAVACIACAEPEIVVVLPMHRNPVVRAVVESSLRGLENVLLIEPLEYGPFARLMAASFLVLTDSGGVQEEAPSLGKPVLVMRDTTERPEAVDAGTVRLVGTDKDTIINEVLTLTRSDDAYRQMATAVNPYGDGHAAERSVAAIEELLGLGRRLPDFDAGKRGIDLDPAIG